MPHDTAGWKDIPREFQDDPTLAWADAVAADPVHQGEASYRLFLELRERYVSLLKRLAKIVKISDGYHLSLKELNVLLSSDARTDYLTGLSNRRDMIERATIEVSRGQRYGDAVAFIICDIDLFKRINDEHGHEAGDRVIIEVSSSLRSSLRREDHCARWGGEEYLICLPKAPLESALLVAEKLRAGVEALEVRYEGGTLKATLSLGVAVISAGESIDDVVRRADRALIEAKQAGRNRVCASRSPS